MKDTCLDTICAELDQERDRLVSMSEGLRAQLHDADRKLKRVQAAIKALAARPDQKKSPRKPSAAKADVINIVGNLLKAKAVLPEAELRTNVEKQIVQSGKSRMGLALRLKEALADTRFTMTPEGYRLTASNGQSGHAEAESQPSR